jgi:hypothetical protein
MPQRSSTCDFCPEAEYMGPDPTRRQSRRLEPTSRAGIRLELDASKQGNTVRQLRVSTAFEHVDSLLTWHRFWIDTLPLNKTDVLPFIDGAGAMPAKYARAIIFQGGKSDPDSQEYMIGPLPVANTTTIQKLDYIYNGGNGGSVPYNARFWDEPRTAATDPLIASIMSNISDITASLFQGAVYYGAKDNRSMCTDRHFDSCYQHMLT